MKRVYVNSPIYAFINNAYNCVMIVVGLLAIYVVYDVLAWVKPHKTIDQSIVSGGTVISQDFVVFQQAHDNIIQIGNENLILGKSIHGAMIMSGHHLPAKTQREHDILSNRIINSRSFAQKLPFPVTEWSAVFTPPCPAFPTRKLQSERGVAMAHYRIWHEFVYFDPYLLSLKQAKGAEYKMNENNSRKSIKSSDGLYEIVEDGSMYKNGQLYSDNDIIIIFEDDSEIAVKNLNHSLVQELSKMDADIVLLGFCNCKYERKPAPMCGHAYAISRSGARKLIEYYEPCGKAWDEQLAILSKHKFISYRTARSENYKNSYLPGYPMKTGKPTDTFGLFVQGKKSMGSMNT